MCSFGFKEYLKSQEEKKEKRRNKKLISHYIHKFIVSSWELINMESFDWDQDHYLHRGNRSLSKAGSPVRN